MLVPRRSVESPGYRLWGVQTIRPDDNRLYTAGAEKQSTHALLGNLVLVPPFAPTDPGTDFNDLAAQHGRAAVRQLAYAELTRQRVKLPAAMVKQAQAEAVITQAARDAARQSTSACTTQTQDRVAPEAARQRPRGLSM